MVDEVGSSMEFKYSLNLGVVAKILRSLPGEIAKAERNADEQ